MVSTFPRAWGVQPPPPWRKHTPRKAGRATLLLTTLFLYCFLPILSYAVFTEWCCTYTDLPLQHGGAGVAGWYPTEPNYSLQRLTPIHATSPVQHAPKHYAVHSCIARPTCAQPWLALNSSHRPGDYIISRLRPPDLPTLPTQTPIFHRLRCLFTTAPSPAPCTQDFESIANPTLEGTVLQRLLSLQRTPTGQVGDAALSARQLAACPLHLRRVCSAAVFASRSANRLLTKLTLPVPATRTISLVLSVHARVFWLAQVLHVSTILSYDTLVLPRVVQAVTSCYIPTCSPALCWQNIAHMQPFDYTTHNYLPPPIL